MKLRIRLLICMLVCFISMTPLAVFAAEELPDADRKGSIHVTIRHNDEAVPGGSLLIYQVAEIKVEEDYKLVITEAFAGSELGDAFAEASNLASDELAAKLAAYAAKERLTGQKLDINEDGRAVADNLSIGLYLVMQQDATEGYAAINPFLIMIPSLVDEKLVYDIDATPKVETEKDKPDNPPSNPPSSPGRPSTIPKTGQLWWPVPVLAVAGLVFLMLGWRKSR